MTFRLVGVVVVATAAVAVVVATGIHTRVPREIIAIDGPSPNDDPLSSVNGVTEMTARAAR